MLRRSDRSFWASVWACVATVISLGCQPKYGRAVSVRLESEPPGAKAYLVPPTDWRANGKERLLSNEAGLKRYFRGITPTNVFASEMKAVYVLRKKGWEDIWQEVPIRFKEGQVFTGQMAKKEALSKD